jgi:hypothetical protein
LERALVAAGTSGSAILNGLGNLWAELRDKEGRSQAWAAFQVGIMKRLGTLTDQSVSFEQLLNMSLKIEDFRESRQATGKSTSDLLGEWLRGSDAA